MHIHTESSTVDGLMERWKIGYFMPHSYSKIVSFDVNFPGFSFPISDLLLVFTLVTQAIIYQKS